MKAINDILSWIQNYWGALMIVFGILGTGLSTIHYKIIMPEIDSHIEKIVYKVADDSLEHLMESHLINRNEGFRGQVQKKTLIPKELVADTVSGIILGEDKIREQLRENTKTIDYLMAWSQMVLKQIAEPYQHRGIPLWRTYYGDFMYLDIFGMVWDAHYVASDDRYYFYPSYANGLRLRCEEYENR